MADASLLSDFDEDQVCRVCRCEGTASHSLFMPCHCKGSVQYVHEDCLRKWIDFSKKKECEICKQPFSFKTVYADNAPSKLAWFDFIRYLSRKIVPFSSSIFRYVVVLSCWILILPLFLSGSWAFLSSEEGVWAYLLQVTTSYSKFGESVLFGVGVACGVVALIFIVDHGRDVINDENLDNRPLHRPGLENEAQEGAAAHPQNGVAANEPAQVGVAADRRQEPLVVQDAGAGVGPVRARERLNVGDDEDSDDDDDDEDQDEFDDGIGGNQADPFGDGEEEEDDEDFDEELRMARLEAIEFFGFEGPWSNFIAQFLLTTVFTFSFVLLFIFAPMRLGRLPLEILFQSALNPACKQPADSSAFGSIPIWSSQLSSMLDNVQHSSVVQNMISCDVTTVPPVLLSILAGYIAFFVILGVLTNAIRAISGQHLPYFLLASWRFAKIIIMFCVHLVVLPLFCGLVVSALCAEFVGVSHEQWLLFLTSSPYKSFIFHWSMGMLFVFQLSIQVDALRKTLRPGVFWFLWSLDDPKFRMLEIFVRQSVLVHARSVVTTGLFFATLIALLIRMPLRGIRLLVPSLFPLSMNLNLVEVVFLQLVYPLVFKLFRSRTGVRALYRSWLNVVGNGLDLHSYLLGDGNYRPRFFMLRVTALLVAAWITLGFMLSVFGSVILILGNFFLSHVLRIHPPNDAFTIVSGFFILRALISTFSKRSRFFSAACKALLVGFLWFIVVPLLAGLLFEVVVLFPLYVSNDHSPSYSIWREWLFGLLFVKLCMVACSFGFLGPERQVAVQRVFEEGGITMTRLSLPIIHTLLLLLVIPYVAVWGALPRLGFSIFLVEWVHRRVYLSLVLIVLLVAVIRLLRKVAARWHDLVRDDLYLVGRILQNHESHIGALAPVAGNVSGS
eukprot:ANDGO_02215.mRNA.1 putative E3 ubiquitin ligase SUD1